MNAVKQPASGPTLGQALAQTFDPFLSDEDYAHRVVHLLSTLANTPFVVLFDAQGQPLAKTGTRGLDETLNNFAHDILSNTQGNVAPKIIEGHAGEEIILPSKSKGVLMLGLPSGGTVAASLAVERLTNLAAMSRQSFLNPNASGLLGLFDTLAQEPVDIQAVASALRRVTGADYTAIATLNEGSVTELAISDQPSLSNRGLLPDRLKQELATAPQTHSDRQLTTRATGPAGAFIVRVEMPKRAASVPGVVAKALAMSTVSASHQNGGLSRKLVRWGGGLAALVGISFLPLPDAERISAEVAAVNARVITAPFTGVVANMAVRENDAVQVDETLLVQLNAAEITEELIAIQAEYAKALLEREAARAGRNAAQLRNAELEAERLRARINLLEARRESATILAPLSGVVAGSDLDALQGATVRQGEAIMRVLDPTDLRLDLQVSDKAVSTLAAGAEGVFRPDFNPSLKFPAQIEFVSPAMTPNSEANTFAGRAMINADAAPLSPGLKGVLSVDREWRPVWSIVWTALRDWVLLRVWL